MATEQTPRISYRLEYVDPTDCRTSPIRISETNGNPRVEAPTIEDAISWLIEHGEYAALMPGEDSEDVIVLLPEPQEGLYKALYPRRMADIGLIDYAAGTALFLRLAADPYEDDDEDEDEPA